MYYQLSLKKNNLVFHLHLYQLIDLVLQDLLNTQIVPH